MGTPFSFEVFKFKSLLRNRSAGDPIARITCRIGLHVVGFGMDDQGRPAVAEHRMIVASEIYLLVRDGHLGRAIGPDHKIRHVAGVVTFRILEPMFFAVGIEMSARRLEVRTLTLGGLM